MHPLLRTIALASSLVLAACSGADEPVSMRFDVEADLSGVLRARGVEVPAAAPVAEASSAGVTWEDRVALVASSGSFETLDGVSLLGVRVRASVDADGIGSARVSLARGDEAAWARDLAPLADEAERVAKARTFDADEGARQIGRYVRFRFELPGDVFGNGVTPRGGGVEEEAEGRTATLLVPVDLARKDGKGWTWVFNWFTP